MIEPVGLEALPPAKRAELIYQEAQAEMSRRLWQVALGSGGAGDGDLHAPRHLLASAMPGTTSLEALLATLSQGSAQRQRAPTSPAAIGSFAKGEESGSIKRLSLPSESPSGRAVAAFAAGTGAVNGLGPNSCYATALADAARRVGVPAPALAAIVEAESGKAADGSWMIYSRNPRSSAAGLGQFLNRTWEGLAETPGTWLNDFAARQGWLGTNGQVRADARAALLAARYDPTAAINGIADYARRNLDGLQRAGVSADSDVVATARLAYLGHHLGLGDAVRFLRGHGLSEGRARILLDAQIGPSNSARRVAATGDATAAHRDWLVGYLDRNIRPDRFATPA